PLAFVVAFLAPVLAADSIGGANFAERYLYLPSIGLAWLVGAAWWRLGWLRLRLRRGEPRASERETDQEEGPGSERGPGGRLQNGFRPIFAALGLAGLAALGVATVLRAQTYRNDLALFTAAVRCSPGSF